MLAVVQALSQTVKSSQIGTCPRYNHVRGFHSFTKRGQKQQFQTDYVIPPDALPKAKPARSKWSRRLLYFSLFLGTGFVFDRTVNASAITRALRCVYHLSFIGLDYKLNFQEGRDIDALHNRSADRLYNLLISNRGLYIKMGQALAIQASQFPPVFQEKFSLLFDMAPQDSWKEMQKLFKQEYGVEADEYFEHINHLAMASASIAQVHRAKLKTGEDVAVKLQHSDLSKQVYWDLTAYKWMMWIFEKALFHVPIYFVAEHVCEQLSKETDFLNEIENSEKLRKLIEADSQFAGRVYVPKVYKELSTRRVIVSEWIDGVTLSNKDELIKQRYNGAGAIDVLTKLFGVQIFQWGHVHCDPHPGNIILRRVNGKQQLVLIDHGLYVSESPQFRRQYSRFWIALFQFDRATLTDVLTEWGIGNAEILANVARPKHKPGKGRETVLEENFEESFEARDMERKQFQDFLKDTTKIPLELIFLGRTMRILQGCNKMFNFPVNRLKIFAYSASRALIGENTTYKGMLGAWRDHLVFVFMVGLSDLAHWFYWAKILFLRLTEVDLDTSELM